MDAIRFKKIFFIKFVSFFNDIDNLLLFPSAILSIIDNMFKIEEKWSIFYWLIIFDSFLYAREYLDMTAKFFHGQVEVVDSSIAWRLYDGCHDFALDVFGCKTSFEILQIVGIEVKFFLVFIFRLLYKHVIQGQQEG